jgi:hypothetical protein
MAEIQQGPLALCYGAPSMTVAFDGGSALGFATTTALVLSDVAHERTADTIETRDAAGNIVNVTTYNAGDTVTLTVKPAGSTRANSKTTNDLFPRPGGYAALVSATDVTYLDNAALTTKLGGITAASAGVAYQIASASKSTTGGGHVTWTIGLRRIDGITSWVPL